MDRHLILGIHVTDRVKNVSKLQALLTDFGCFIKTRLGLHEVSESYCATSGVILIEFLDNEEKYTEFKGKLAEVEGIDIQEMVFTH